ncbi:galactose mutarotase [Streptococcus sp. X16XC17]|uniref:aldose epimerase family protein n=1 Tax=unclassified Streptococcus TaxID=2608887 RepID=UPI0006A7EF66|nr:MULTISPECIES: hypothetical protein [unclassified Streptococcus]TCD45855.1 galactose mutarotase [Streptococcus sp. X16XC17]
MAAIMGRVDGRDIYSYILKNSLGSRVTVLSLGGIIHEFSLLHGDKRVNHVLSFDSIEEYVENPFQVNKQIGRVAGRIRQAQFNLAGKEYQLEPNAGAHLLHGGRDGLSTCHFDLVDQTEDYLLLHTLLTEESDGFPGTIDLLICYHLSEESELTVRYKARTIDGPTVFDPTLHTYWKLSEQLAAAEIYVDSQACLELDAEQVPTGNLVTLQAGVDDLSQWTIAQSLTLDHAYLVDGDMTKPCVVVRDQEKQIELMVSSDRNGLVLFTANPCHQEAQDAGQFNCLATEPQTLPDSLHHPEFGDIRLQKGETKVMTMVFQLTALSSQNEKNPFSWIE